MSKFVTGDRSFLVLYKIKFVTLESSIMLKEKKREKLFYAALQKWLNHVNYVVEREIYCVNIWKEKCWEYNFKNNSWCITWNGFWFFFFSLEFPVFPLSILTLSYLAFYKLLLQIWHLTHIFNGFGFSAFFLWWILPLQN